MTFAGITLVCGLILSVLTHNKGMSATCIADGNEVISVFNSRDIDVISNIPAVPRCIRCAHVPTTPPFIPIFNTDPNYVSYLSGGNPLMNGSGITIFNDGLLVEDPASSFNNEDIITCRFNNVSNSFDHTITFKITVFLPPPITPNGTVLDYVEGDNVTLTCTGNSNFDDRYQWTLPDGSNIPIGTTVADGGLDVELKNVNRTDSGVYNCTGTISGVSVSVVSSVTLNIQYPARVLSLVGNSANLSIGSLLTLNCSFEGNPTPSISWSHNGNIVPSDNITDNYALLEITLDSSQSFGEYTCIVNNTISNTPVSDSMTYSVLEPDSSTSSTTSTTVSVHDETTSITTSTIANVCDETCVTTVVSTPSSKQIMPSMSVSGQPTIISELQNHGSLPSYGVILVVLLSIISVLSITINIVIVLVVWYWRKTKTTTKSSTGTTATVVPNSNDVLVDDNSAYGMRDTRLISEQQQTRTENEVIYEPL